MNVRQLFDLSGKAAIVTGASAGLGVWFSRGLAEAGAAVVLAARRAEKLEDVAVTLRSEGARALAVPTDVTSEDQVQALVDKTLAHFARIDILVNNAGMGVDEGGAEKQPLALFRQVLEVNLIGTVICCQRVGRVMLEQGEGRIINVSSVHGFTADASDSSGAYCSSKAAVVNLTRELAKQWAPRGVRVNGIAPGLFRTEMTEWYFEDAERERKVMESIPVGRVGREDDLKGLVVFLASPASDYVVGHTIVIDGGQTLC